jgi:hypothetical protein
MSPTRWNRQLTELGNSDFAPWAKEIFEIATNYLPRRRTDWDSEGWQYGLAMMATAPVLPVDTLLLRAALLTEG